MRSDIAPAPRSPTTSCPTTTNVPRKLSELQGDDPLILTLARGHYCPKEHQQHLELAAFYPKIAVAYTQVATISTDAHHELQEFRASVGAQWPFLSDPGRIVQKDLDIQEYTDPEHDPMIPHTLVLKPGLVVHSIYNGYWFWGRPSVVDLWHDLRAVTQRDPPRLGPQHPRAARGLGRGRPLALPRLEQARHRKPDRRGVEGLRCRSERRVRVVVDSSRSELAALPERKQRPRPRRQLRLPPPYDVVLQGTCALVVGDRATLKRNATPVREQPLVELPKGRKPLSLPESPAILRKSAAIRITEPPRPMRRIWLRDPFLTSHE